MAWCPSCHTEYREGITVCSDCGQALVDALLEAPHSGFAIWARQARSDLLVGMRLFPRAARLTLRLRQLWIVLALLSLAGTILAITPYRSATPGSAKQLLTGLGQPPDETPLRLAASHWIEQWQHPSDLVTNLTRGVNRPLALAPDFWLSAVIWRIAANNPRALQVSWRRPWTLLYLVALPYAVRAAILAGLLGMPLAGLRRQPQGAAAFKRGVARGTGWIFVWLLALWALGWPLGWAEARLQETRAEALGANLASLLYLLFLFTPYLIAARGVSAFRAMGRSARFLVARPGLLVGFLLPYRVAGAALGIFWGAERYYLFMFGDPLWRPRWLVPPALLGLDLAAYALALTSAIALLLMAERKLGRPAELEVASPQPG